MPFQPSVLRSLAERVILPGLIDGPSDEPIYAEDLMDSYGTVRLCLFLKFIRRVRGHKYRYGFVT